MKDLDISCGSALVEDVPNFVEIEVVVPNPIWYRWGKEKNQLKDGPPMSIYHKNEGVEKEHSTAGGSRNLSKGDQCGRKGRAPGLGC